ncbi:LysR family transcriptional regulator [Pseudoroseomonas deserti]|uniref:LysR family transcriptional regulator n=1 Tax=Teichococcus deserti TaxID=1817963 RepID=A0A1V2H1L7_9PROT|nr:LysR family transcriptional regulator [Pseudoroseomonas deserti]ONG50925.1 LysR family transcriptional regulator [Pseudoroseomonas deserti]
MNGIDALALDGHALRLFLAVLEEGSVTGAATRLGLSQSAASHGLIRLRGLLGDPLFVKSGRGITATPHARSLAAPAQALLDGLQGLARPADFLPERARLSLTIAANDFQRDLLLPAFFARLRATVASVSLLVVPSGAPSAALLRERGCDLIITPIPPAGTDILQKRLLTDRYACFYDPACRAAPRDAAEYLAARHITVLHPEGEPLEFDRRLEAEGITRDIALRVPGFTGIFAFLRGGEMLATLPGLLRHGGLAGLASVKLPPLLGNSEEPLDQLPLYMAWHRRDQQDPRHAWLRAQLVQVAAEVTRARA